MQKPRMFWFFFPGYGTCCSFQYQVYTLRSIQPQLPLWNWKLFMHMSNHCPVRYPCTPGSRECTYRWSVLPKDTAPPCHNWDPHLTPLNPKWWVIATTPWHSACVWSINSDVGILRVVSQGACHLWWFSYAQFIVSEAAPPFVWSCEPQAIHRIHVEGPEKNLQMPLP